MPLHANRHSLTLRSTTSTFDAAQRHLLDGSAELFLTTHQNWGYASSTPAPLPFEDFSCPQLTERAQATEPASVTAAARRATHPAPLSHSVALPPVPNGQITYACCERPSQRGSRKHGYQLHVHGDPAKYSPKWITRHAFTMYELANICDTQVPADRCEIANVIYSPAQRPSCI